VVALGVAVSVAVAEAVKVAVAVLVTVSVAVGVSVGVLLVVGVADCACDSPSAINDEAERVDVPATTTAVRPGAGLVGRTVSCEKARVSVLAASSETASSGKGLALADAVVDSVRSVMLAGTLLPSCVAVAVTGSVPPDEERESSIANVTAKARTATAAMATTISLPISRRMS